MAASPQSSIADSLSDEKKSRHEDSSRSSTPVDADAASDHIAEQKAGFTIKSILGLPRENRNEQSRSPLRRGFHEVSGFADTVGHSELLKPTPLIRPLLGGAYPWISPGTSAAYGPGFSPFGYHLQSSPFASPHASFSGLSPNPFVYGTFFGRPIPLSGMYTQSSY